MSDVFPEAARWAWTWAAVSVVLGLSFLVALFSFVKV